MSTIKITVTAPEAPPAGYKGNPEGVQNFLAEVALKAIRGMGFMVNMSGKTEEMAFRTIGQLAMDYRVEIEVKPFVKPEEPKPAPVVEEPKAEKPAVKPEEK